MVIGHDDADVDESSCDDVDHINLVDQHVFDETEMFQDIQNKYVGTTTTNDKICEFFTSFLSSASFAAQLPLTFTRFLALGLEMSQVLILHKIKPRFSHFNLIKLF